MKAVLLPGMDGTGALFRWFVEKLPAGVDAQIVSYPPDVPLSYSELSSRVLRELPAEEPYIIVAESYSGAVAVLLSSRAGPNLQAIVLVASFVRPSGSGVTRALARFSKPGLFGLRPPGWILKILMLGSACTAEVLPCLRQAISSVRPDVLAARFQNALEVDVSETLAKCPVRVVYLSPDQDRLLRQTGLRGVLHARPSTEVFSIPGPHLLLQCNPEGAVRALQQAGLLHRHL
jgi:pimeloyl-[acyl-carrier protein] methyl ester esterase